MKFRLFLTTVITALPFLTAAHPLIFTPSNDEIQSQVCLAAAEKGMESAEELLKEYDIPLKYFREHFTCNELDIEIFAKKMEHKRKRSTNGLWMSHELNL